MSSGVAVVVSVAVVIVRVMSCGGVEWNGVEVVVVNICKCSCRCSCSVV